MAKGKEVKKVEELISEEVIVPSEMVKKMVFVTNMSTKKKLYKRGDVALLTEKEIDKYEKFDVIVKPAKWEKMLKEIRIANGARE